MRMRYTFSWLVIAAMTVFLLAACGEDSSNSGASGDSDDNIQAVASFSILSDIVEEVGGDLVDVYNIVPVGNDPHDHEATPDDSKETADADVFFYNGLNLEGGNSGWVSKLLESTGMDDDQVFETSEGIEPKYLGEAEENEGEVNPHAFIDPNVGMKITENVRDGLIQADPDHEEEYKENAEKYLDKLDEMDQEYQEKIDDIPEEDRVFVASERAFQYMVDRYGLDEGFIWEVDTEENGTPDQIKNAVAYVEENDPSALFVESNVDKRPMETVSDETGVDIAGEIYSDELGEEGSDGDTYLGYLKSNIDTIHDGLAE